jgi:hypothetical protein
MRKMHGSSSDDARGYRQRGHDNAKGDAMMTKRKTLVRAMLVEMPCQACEKGTIERDDRSPIRCSNPPQIRHVCTACGCEEWILGTWYPQVVHIRR